MANIPSSQINPQHEQEKEHDLLFNRLEGVKLEHYKLSIHALEEDDGKLLPLQTRIKLLKEYLYSNCSYKILTEKEVLDMEDIL